MIDTCNAVSILFPLVNPSNRVTSPQGALHHERERFLTGATMPKGDGKTPSQRIAERYTVDPITGCWNWTGAQNGKGYGVTHDKRGRSRLVHRIFYESARGAIAEGMTLDHLCRNRKCVNPSHLEVVTLAENLRRGLRVRSADKRKAFEALVFRNLSKP